MCGNVVDSHLVRGMLERRKVRGKEEGRGGGGEGKGQGRGVRGTVGSLAVAVDS